MFSIPIIQQASQFLDQTAITDSENSYMYSALISAAQNVAYNLTKEQGDVKEARIAFLCPPNFHYVAIQWGIWLAGGIAVPLCPKHPLAEMEYVLEDSQTSMLIVHDSFKKQLKALAETKQIVFWTTNEVLSFRKNKQTPNLPNIDTQRSALILYTSGTTGKPKGVVSTHDNITAQISCLIAAWQWSSKDYIVHVLPLHHTHGIINKLCCALWSGATCHFLPKFDAKTVWDTFEKYPVTTFMAVPTIYKRLIAIWEQASEKQQQKWSEACQKMRLMVSGSAALPVRTLEQWREISGHTLLERYGMTEIGMALSNPYEGERKAGYVGQPLPTVCVQIVNENNEVVESGEQGELQVKGPNVFLKYWNRPEATEKAFKNAWFCTGDMVKEENGWYKIIGRNSVDIIKTGGYKVSALEIEEVLRQHQAIQECAVVGIPDDDWGERVCAAVILKKQEQLTLQELQQWLSDCLAPYKIPTQLLIVDDLPRNVMGKVTKPAIKELLLVTGY